MAQTLYRFGFNADDATNKTTIPTSILTASQIDILWISWCDLIYSICDSTNTQSLTYSGTSLNTLQRHDFTDCKSHVTQSLLNPRCRLRFFGSTMHDGVRGYMMRREHGSVGSMWDDGYDDLVCIFTTESEKKDGLSIPFESESWTIPPPHPFSLTAIRLCNDSSLLFAVKVGIESDNHDHRIENKGSISTVKKFQDLREFCKGHIDGERLAEFAPVQLVVNATTATALDDDGRVHTRTADPRYPACLGRLHTGTSTFEPVTYLSETHIIKIASGGYLTAAISEDGELFLWGQAIPGTEGEFGVLHRLDYESGAALKETAVWSDTEPDEFVKCLNIRIDGKGATAYDVAIGFGHILIAAKNDDGAHIVFAAGCGSEGQLGMGRIVNFMEEFEEVVALRGKPILQLEAAGWSSCMVTEDFVPM